MEWIGDAEPRTKKIPTAILIANGRLFKHMVVIGGDQVRREEGFIRALLGLPLSHSTTAGTTMAERILCNELRRTGISADRT